MAEFTKEQLIAEVHYNLEHCFCSEKTKRLMEIALAVLEASPEAYVVGSYSLLHYQNPKLDEYIKNATPLYRLPLLEGLK